MPKLGYSEKFVTVLMIGEKDVGKTTIVKRLRGEDFETRSISSNECYESQFSIKLWSTGTFDGPKEIILKLVDVGNEILEQYVKSTVEHTKKGQKVNPNIKLSSDDSICNSSYTTVNDLRSLIEHCDGFLYVVDVTSFDSLKAINEYQAMLPRIFHPQLIFDIPKVLAAHKYDRQGYEPVISSLLLDSIAMTEGFAKWHYTVGSPLLLDFSPTRPAWSHQSCPEELVRTLVRLILRKRYGDNSPIPAPNELMVPLNPSPYASKL